MRTLAAIALTLALAITAAAQAKGTITGRVVTGRGKSLAGASVRAVTLAGDEAAVVTTDWKGVFRLEVMPGDYRLEFEAVGHTRATLRDVVRAEAGRETKVKRKVALPDKDDGSLIRGSVFREDGRSLPGARVVIERVVSQASPNATAFVLQAVSDRMGLFAFKVPAGEHRYVITASRPGFRAQTTTVDVSGGETVNVALKLPETN